MRLKLDAEPQLNPKQFLVPVDDARHRKKHKRPLNLPDKQLSNAKLYRRPLPKRWTIHKCLLVLGGKRQDVYRGKNEHHSAQRHSRSQIGIYNRYTLDEINEWLDKLWNIAKIKYHPDKHPPKRRKFYTMKFQEIMMAYYTGHKIIGNKINPPRSLYGEAITIKTIQTVINDPTIF